MREQRFWRYENRLLLILVLTFGFVFFDRNAFAYLAPFIAPDLGLSNTNIGMIVSGLSLTWAVSGILIGALSDSTGRRKGLLVICVIVFSICSVLSGMATSFMFLLAARLLMGLSEGGVAPISQSLIALESSEKRRGLNMGIMQNFGSNLFGSFVAPLVIVAIANAFDWRIAFYLAALPGLVIAVFIARYVREAGTHVADASPAAGAQGREMRVVDMFRHRNIWLCIAISCFMVAWMVLGWTFLPVFYVQAKGISSSQMSVMMSVLGISATVCSFLVPGLSDRIGRKPVMIIFSAIGVLVPLAALYYSGPLFILAVLLFVGWSASGIFPMFMATIPSETIPRRYLATAMGVVMGLGELVGGVLSPTGAGWVADQVGLEGPILIQAGCTLAAAVLTLFLKETAPIKLERKAKAALA